MTDKKYNEIMSPCKDKCMQDIDNEYCIVCMRTIEEKRNWWKFTKEEKLEILENLKTRKHK